MIKRILPICVALAVLCILGGLAYFYNFGSGSAGVPVTSPDNNVIGGPVTAISAASITVKKQDGTQKTLAITGDTQVVSQVSAGETGKSLSDIMAGSVVLVIPSANGSAQSINILPAQTAPAVPASGATAVTVQGTVGAKSATSLGLRVSHESTVAIGIPAKVAVLSNVLAGQAGTSYEDIAIGDMIQVSGTQTASGITAQSIRVLTPLSPQAQ